MRDAPRELPHRFELLTLMKRFLDPAPFGHCGRDPFLERVVQQSQLMLSRLEIMDVGAGSKPTDDLAAKIANALSAPNHPAKLAASMAKPIFDLVGLARRQALPPDRPGSILIVG